MLEEHKVLSMASKMLCSGNLIALSIFTSTHSEFISESAAWKGFSLKCLKNLFEFFLHIATF